MEESIFEIGTSHSFNDVALQIFRYQAKSCQIYKDYLKCLNINPSKINRIEKIPFLPIQFFKTKEVKSFNETAEKIFYSSSTTSQVPSQHFVKKLDLYEKSFFRTFEMFYPKPEAYTIIGLLPSYLEREGSSLIYMVKRLMEKYGDHKHRFFKTIDDALLNILKQGPHKQEKFFLIGVSYALIDLMEKLDFSLHNTIVMETGGMKGKRTEMVKEAFHKLLMDGLGVANIHSEYGMTELLSQAYAQKDGLFFCPPWMKVLTREINDPFHLVCGKTGAINVMDLANIHSCSFIATDDAGVCYQDGSFEVLGRLDGSESRGCNLLYSF